MNHRDTETRRAHRVSEKNSDILGSFWTCSDVVTSPCLDRLVNFVDRQRPQFVSIEATRSRRPAQNADLRYNSWSVIPAQERLYLLHRFDFHV